MDTPSIYVKGWLSPAGVEAVRAVLRAAFATVGRLQVTGLEHLPAGGCLVCPNHLSYFDSPLVFSLLRGRPVTAFAADTYRERAVFRAFVQQVDTIWVHRGAIGPSTIKVALQALRAGRILGLAPEGTRSRSGGLIEGKPGAAALALAAGVPIVPVGVAGAEQLSRALSGLRFLAGDRPAVTVAFGRPFSLPALARGERAGKLDAYTAEIMCQIGALLPSEYRGVYAQHPRLHALLAEAEAARNQRPSAA